MKRIQRIILQETRGPVLIALIVLTFVVFTREFGRLAELLIRRNAEVTTVAKAVLYLLPSILIFTVPFAFLIGTLIGFSRLSSDSEIIAMRAGGVSSLQMLRPVLKGGVVVVLLTAAFIYFLPDANWSLRLLRHEIRVSPVFSQVKPRVFFEELPGFLLYVEDIDPAVSVWEGVFVADTSVPEEKRLILAERGRVLSQSDERRRLQLHFENGTAYSLSTAAPERISVSRFGTLDIPMELPSDDGAEARTKRPQDRTLEELWADIHRDDTRAAQSSMVELNRRLALPVSGVIFALLAVSLGIQTPRGGRGYGFMLSFVVAFLYYVLFATGSSLARSGFLPTWLGVWSANLVMLVIGLVSLRLADRESAVFHRFTNWGGFVGTVNLLGEGVLSGWRLLQRLGGSFRHHVRRLPALRLRLARVVDLYVARIFLGALLTTLTVCLLLVCLFTFFEIVDSIFENEIPFPIVLDYFIFLQPHLWMLLVPISVLIATLVTFGSLEKTNQIIALKSCGVSVFRVAMPVVLAAIGICSFIFLIQEYVLPYANQRQDNLRNIIKGNPVQTSLPGRHWIFGDDGRLYHYSAYARDRQAFLDFFVYRLDFDGSRIQRVTYASRAHWDHQTGKWDLRSGWTRDFQAGEFAGFDSRLADFPEGPDFFTGGVLDSSKLTYLELQRYIDDLQTGGFEVDYLRTELYKKLSFPAVNIVMALLGLPFALTMGKKGALYGIAAGVILGIAYWGAFGVFDVLGANGLLAPVLAAWGPNIVFGAGAMYLFSHVRT